MLPTSDRFAEECHAALLETMRRRLKMQVLKAIDAEVDLAVDEAVKNLGVTLNFMVDPYMGRNVVEVILKK